MGCFARADKISFFFFVTCIILFCGGYTPAQNWQTESVREMAAKEMKDMQQTAGGDVCATRRKTDRENKEVFWLHFPKCGTSFKMSLDGLPLHRTRSGSNHQSLSVIDDVSQLCATVAIFREPSQREASAYNWIKREPRCCTKDWGWKEEVFKPMKANIDSNKYNLSESIGKFKGCMTKMILGYGCMENKTITQKDVDVAITRIKNFKFFGITNDWKNSVCLFNYRMTGKKFVTLRSLSNVRPTNAQTKDISQYDEPTSKDPFDGRLYQEALKIYKDRLKEHGINEGECVTYGLSERKREMYG